MTKLNSLCSTSPDLSLTCSECCCCLCRRTCVPVSDKQTCVWWLTDREGSDALLVRAQGLGDGAHGSAVVSVLHVTQALLGLRKLLQAIQPEVEVLRCYAGAQTLVQLARELMAALQTTKKQLQDSPVGRLLETRGTLKLTIREACRAIRYTVQPLATFSSCCLMMVFTSADRDDWLATKITVAKETCSNQSDG